MEGTTENTMEALLVVEKRLEFDAEIDKVWDAITTPLEDTPNTTVEWNLSVRPGGGTILVLRESGFGTEALRQGNDEGWDKELGELTDYLAD